MYLRYFVFEIRRPRFLLEIFHSTDLIRYFLIEIFYSRFFIQGFYSRFVKREFSVEILYSSFFIGYFSFEILHFRFFIQDYFARFDTRNYINCHFNLNAKCDVNVISSIMCLWSLVGKWEEDFLNNFLSNLIVSKSPVPWMALEMGHWENILNFPTNPTVLLHHISSLSLVLYL